MSWFSYLLFPGSTLEISGGSSMIYFGKNLTFTLVLTKSNCDILLQTAPLMLDLEMKNDLIVVRSATKGGAAADNGM